MKFFDTHAHIGLIYDDPIEQLRVIQQAKQAGVARIISINNSLMDFPKVYNTLKSVSGIYHAAGVAPSEVNNPGSDWINTLEKNLSLPRVIAVGETGLDYYKQFGDKRSQIELFITQLEIAQKHNLPVIIHNREAGKDVYDILQVGDRNKFYANDILVHNCEFIGRQGTLIESTILRELINKTKDTTYEYIIDNNIRFYKN